MKISLILGISALFCPTGFASQAGTGGNATYLANAGVIVQRGETKILFDPLYRLNHGYYLSIPDDIENALLVGTPPFEGIDAVFISHFHSDHFSPTLLLNYLMINTEVRLFAPEQVVAALRQFASKDDSALLERVRAIDLTHRAAPVSFELEGILIEAVRIPHSGWPDSNRETENLVFRVTLNGDTTVLHLGDADAQETHFSRLSDFWEMRNPDMVFPPYWFFLSLDGLEVLNSHIRANQAVGVHVPTEIQSDPDSRPQELRGFDLFTQAGETRKIGDSD